MAVCGIDPGCSNGEKKSLNPNGDSELALLMRKMASQTESLKVSLYKKENIGAYPSDYEKMLTATPTDSTLNRTLFNGFATDYLSKVKIFYSSPDTLQIKNYNLMVNSCITCHRNFCNGPLKRIKKMLI
ncbi:MAG TPA: hypothetical protein VII99_02025 [Bacteroidia bacterium]